MSQITEHRNLITMECKICNFPISDVHHIIPKKYGGTDDMDNLVNLCPNHHRSFHKLLSGVVYNSSKSFYANTNTCFKEDLDLEITFDYLLKNEKELCGFFTQYHDQIFNAVSEYYDNKRNSSCKN